MKKIRINCIGADQLSIDQIENFQGELKTITPENVEKLKQLIIKLGFIAPFFIWKKVTKSGLSISFKLLDGHQRIKALRALQKEGYELELFPVSYIKARTEKEARESLLAITSAYGEFDEEVLKVWLEQVDEETADLFRFTDNEIDIDEEIEKKELYSKKILAPIYEPKKEMPEVNQLYNTGRTQALIRNIMNSSVPADIKTFLHSAAQRHIIFNYEKIADYYAQAPREIQELFEESGLVIIDYEKAIENGFVRLSKEIIKQFGKDYDR